jgi:hypothetical protein
MRCMDSWWPPFSACCIAGLLFLGDVNRVEAQPSEEERTAEARRLFEQGLQLLDERDWEAAAARFQAAWELRQSPQIAYNLTSALIPLGQLVRAARLLRQVSADLGASIEVRQAATARRAELLPRIGTLTIPRGRNTAEDEIFLDDHPLGDTDVGAGISVDPGTHRITVRRNGREVFARELDFHEGAQHEVRIELSPESNEEGVPAASSPLPAQETTEDDDATEVIEAPVAATTSRRPRRRLNVVRAWWFWTIIGAAVAGTAVGLGLGLGLEAPEAEPVDGLERTVYIGAEK